MPPEEADGLPSVEIDGPQGLPLGAGYSFPGSPQGVSTGFGVACCCAWSSGVAAGLLHGASSGSSRGMVSKAETAASQPPTITTTIAATIAKNRT